MRMEDAIDEQEPVQPKTIVKKEDKYPIDTLPSQYKLYPKGTKLYGRPLTVREVKKLSTINEQNFDIVIKDVLSNAITGLPIDNILSGDKLYLIFWLRANTYKNARFVSQYICEHCGKKEEYRFDVDAFDINYIDDDFDGNLEIKLLNKEDVITFGFSTIKDEEKLKRYVDINKEFLSYDDEILAIASMIKSVNGRISNLADVAEYIMNLNAEDFAYIHSYVLSIDFGINPIITTKCTKCGGENSVRINFRPEFFIPTYNFR